VAPVSSIMAEVNSAAFASSASAALFKRARRALGPISAQAGKGRAEALAARFASSTEAAAALVAHSPVMGLRRSKVFPPLAGVSFAPINSCVFMTLILRSAIKRFGIYYPWMPVLGEL